MKSEHSSQELLDLLKSNERLLERLRAFGDADLLDTLATELLSEQTPSSCIATPSALYAALRVTFTADEIDGATEQKEAVLGEASQQICNGLSRLRLSDGYRGQVLLDAQRRGELEAALRLTERQDQALLSELSSDTIALDSAWLRQLLRRDPVNLERFSHQHVSAAYRARLALSECEALLLGQPTLSDVRRQMQWLELIEPLRLMIGAPERSPDIDELQGDRFAGRADELRRLRSLVDELESQGALESFSRVVSRAGRLLSGKPRLMMVSARGGLGKSTLVSKFAYDHAVMSRGMPFAYLDFDSAVLQPRSPLLLLAEIARQVSLFYPHAVELESFVESVRQEVLKVSRQSIPDESAATQGGVLLYSAELFDRFRQLLQGLIANYASRSFLLILDTLELVQSDPLAIEGVQQLLKGLVEEDFPELVVVASGRAEVPELYEGEESRWRITTMELEPFNDNDASAMVQLLGESLLPGQWQKQWSRQIAGKSRASAGREPLSLRIAVEAIRDAEAKSRETLVREIAEMGEGCDPASVDFVGRLYQKRILEHIADPYARRLAWPGLVARSLSEVLARDVLARECELTPEQASTAFHRLKREVWIVTQEGENLRHRSDLRARTLPLMRRHDEVLFKRICALMSAHHLGKHPAESAEATYYRLLADDSEATRILDQDGSGPLQQMLLQRQDDFVSTSRLAQDLKVRQASRVLPLPEFNRLPPDLAWRHVVQSGQVLRNVVDHRIDSRVIRLSRDIESSPYRSLSSAEQTILIKTGRWSELARQEFVTPEGAVDLHAAAFMGHFLCVSFRSQGRWMDGFTRFIKTANLEKWDWRTLSYLLLPSYRFSLPLYNDIDWLLARKVPDGKTNRSSWLPVLRVALAFGTQSLKSALYLLLGYEGGPRAARVHFSNTELLALKDSRALSGRLFNSNSSLNRLLGRNDDEDDVDSSAFRIIKGALNSLEKGSLDSPQVRQDIRIFALAGSADLASTAGYLLKLSGGPLPMFRRLGTRRQSTTMPDLINICRHAEGEQKLPELLDIAMREVEHPEMLDNLGMLKMASEGWSFILGKSFEGELP